MSPRETITVRIGLKGYVCMTMVYSNWREKKIICILEKLKSTDNNIGQTLQTTTDLQKRECYITHCRKDDDVTCIP